MKKIVAFWAFIIGISILTACGNGYKYEYNYVHNNKYEYRYVYNNPFDDEKPDTNFGAEDMAVSFPVLSDETVSNLTTKVRAEVFSTYESFGLIYDVDADRLYFDGELVRYFEDADRHIYWPNENGEIELYAVRNENGVLEAIKPIT